MSAEVIVLPEQINELVQNTNSIETTRAQSIAAKYVPFMEKVTEQMEILKKLEIGNDAHVPIARRVKLDLGKICSSATKQKGIDKAKVKEEAKFYDALFNTVNGAARISQGEAQEIEDYPIKLEQERLEGIQLEREIAITEYIEDASDRDLSGMADDVWDAFFTMKKKAYEDKIEAEKEAKRLAEEAEVKRLAEVEELQIKNEKLRKEQAEKDRLAKIAADKQKAELDKANKAKAEAEKLLRKAEEEKDEVAREQKQKREEFLKGQDSFKMTALSDQLAHILTVDLELKDLENEMKYSEAMEKVQEAIDILTR